MQHGRGNHSGWSGQAMALCIFGTKFYPFMMDPANTAWLHVCMCVCVCRCVCVCVCVFVCKCVCARMLTYSYVPLNC